MMIWEPEREAREYQPDFDADERAHASEPRRKMARDLALALLKKHKITAPPIDVEALAKACGLAVAYVNVAGKLSGQLYPGVPEMAVNTRSPTGGSACTGADQCGGTPASLGRGGFSGTRRPRRDSAWPLSRRPADQHRGRRRST